MNELVPLSLLVRLRIKLLAGPPLYKLPSKTGYRRKDKGRDGSDKKTRKKTKLLDDIKDRRGYSHLKEEVRDRTMWRNRFSGGFGPVVRQNTE